MSAPPRKKMSRPTLEDRAANTPDLDVFDGRILAAHALGRKLCRPTGGAPHVAVCLWA
jgi:hypothetical protein